MTRILALDLATQVGWAYAAGNETPLYGSERMGKKDADVDDKALALFHWLHRKIEELRPQYLVFEAPILTRTDNVDLVQLLFGLPQIAAVVAKMHDVIPYKAPGMKCTRIFTGISKFEGWDSATRRKNKKLAVMQTCHEHGWNPPDDNAADALAVLYYAQSILGRGTVQRAAGPLFGGRAA